MRKFPIGVRHSGHYRRNTPMNRFDVSCTCGWNAYADTPEEVEEAHKAHVKQETKEPML